jgi:hypothetical protein
MGSSGGHFFLSSSAELLMMPKGLRISWETPATISPNGRQMLGRLSCSFKLQLSWARFWMMLRRA